MNPSKMRRRRRICAGTSSCSRHRSGPHQIGIEFPRYTAGGYVIAKAVIVSPDYPLGDRVLERGELLIVTADHMALLRFIEDSGMFRRVGLTDSQKTVSF